MPPITVDAALLWVVIIQVLGVASQFAVSMYRLRSIEKRQDKFEDEYVRKEFHEQDIDHLRKADAGLGREIRDVRTDLARVRR